MQFQFAAPPPQSRKLEIPGGEGEGVKKTFPWEEVKKLAIAKEWIKSREGCKRIEESFTDGVKRNSK